MSNSDDTAESKCARRNEARGSAMGDVLTKIYHLEDKNHPVDKINDHIHVFSRLSNGNESNNVDPELNVDCPDSTTVTSSLQVKFLSPVFYSYSLSTFLAIFLVLSSQTRTSTRNENFSGCRREHR